MTSGYFNLPGGVEDILSERALELENLRNNIDNLQLGDFSIQGLDNSNDNFLIKIELSQEYKVDQAKLISELVV